MPTDQQLELDHWAETGEFDNTELHEVSTACVQPHCQCALVRKYFWNIASLHTGSAVHFKQIGEVFRDGNPHQSTTF